MTKPRNDERDRSTPIMAWPSFGTGPSLEAMQPTVEGMAEFNGKTISGWTALQREWTGFLMHRVQEEVALAHRLAKCSGPQDAFDVYANFYQQAFADYQREFGELMRLGQTSLSEATSAAQKTTETATRDTPRAAA
jgi:Phasin protein